MNERAIARAAKNASDALIGFGRIRAQIERRLDDIGLCRSEGEPEASCETLHLMIVDQHLADQAMRAR
jgi:hypothetical protein